MNIPKNEVFEQIHLNGWLIETFKDLGNARAQSSVFG